MSNSVAAATSFSEGRSASPAAERTAAQLNRTHDGVMLIRRGVTSSGSNDTAFSYDASVETRTNHLHMTDPQPLRSRKRTGSFTTPAIADDYKSWKADKSLVRKKKLPRAKLPKGWQPVNEDYDDVTSHTLWRLEDGANDVSLVAQNAREVVYDQTLTRNLPSAPSSTIDRFGSDLDLPLPRTTTAVGGDMSDFNTSVQQSRSDSVDPSGRGGLFIHPKSPPMVGFSLPTAIKEAALRRGSLSPSADRHLLGTLDSSYDGVSTPQPTIEIEKARVLRTSLRVRPSSGDLLTRKYQMKRIGVAEDETVNPQEFDLGKFSDRLAFNELQEVVYQEEQEANGVSEEGLLKSFQSPATAAAIEATINSRARPGSAASVVNATLDRTAHLVPQQQDSRSFAKQLREQMRAGGRHVDPPADSRPKEQVTLVLSQMPATSCEDGVDVADTAWQQSGVPVAHPTALQMITDEDGNSPLLGETLFSQNSDNASAFSGVQQGIDGEDPKSPFLLSGSTMGIEQVASMAMSSSSERLSSTLGNRSRLSSTSSFARPGTAAAGSKRKLSSNSIQDVTSNGDSDDDENGIGSSDDDGCKDVKKSMRSASGQKETVVSFAADDTLLSEPASKPVAAMKRKGGSMAALMDAIRGSFTIPPKKTTSQVQREKLAKPREKGQSLGLPGTHGSVRFNEIKNDDEGVKEKKNEEQHTKADGHNAKKSKTSTPPPAPELIEVGHIVNDTPLASPTPTHDSNDSLESPLAVRPLTHHQRPQSSAARFDGGNSALSSVAPSPSLTPSKQDVVVPVVRRRRNTPSAVPVRCSSAPLTRDSLRRNDVELKQQEKKAAATNNNTSVLPPRPKRLQRQPSATLRRMKACLDTAVETSGLGDDGEQSPLLAPDEPLLAFSSGSCFPMVAGLSSKKLSGNTFTVDSTTVSEHNPTSSLPPPPPLEYDPFEALPILSATHNSLVDGPEDLSNLCADDYAAMLQGLGKSKTETRLRRKSLDLMELGMDRTGSQPRRRSLTADVTAGSGGHHLAIMDKRKPPRPTSKNGVLGGSVASTPSNLNRTHSVEHMFSSDTMTAQDLLKQTSSLAHLEPDDVDGLWGFEVEHLVEESRLEARGTELSSENLANLSQQSWGPMLSPQNGLGQSMGFRSTGTGSSIAGTPLASPATRAKASHRLRRKILDLERQRPNLVPRITVEFFDVSEMETLAEMKAIERKPTFITPRSRPDSANSESALAEPRLLRGGRRRSSFSDFIATDEITHEGLTHIPPQELHLYQMFCAQTNTILIFRPVSPAVPSMYAGNAFVPRELCDDDGIPLTVDEIDPDLTLEDISSFTTRESRVKGKGIGVSLKSSPYPPIEGFIPVNPHLSKTYSEAQKKERQLEEKLMNNNALQAVSASTDLLKKIRVQRNFFGAATSVAMKEIEASLEASDKKLAKMLEEYRAESMVAFDKLPVAMKFINTLNETQFLGKTNATWRGNVLYFRHPKDKADIERLQGGQPQFYARRGNVVFKYNHVSNELLSDWQESFEILRSELQVVEILTHRSFIISELSQRIEPDPAGDFIIGPDFDGLAYATCNPVQGTVRDYMQFCEERMALHLVPSMGSVSQHDINHVLEMRLLTEWKQNHGYECCNTVKTQELGDGNYIIITPKAVKVPLNFLDIIEAYREYWGQGYPLLLNPNWKVIVDPADNLPVIFGEEPSLPIIDDCGMALLKDEISEEGANFENLKTKVDEFVIQSIARQEKIDAMKAAGEKNIRVPKVPFNALVEHTALVMKKKSLAERFYDVRRWTLMPTYTKPKVGGGDFFETINKSPRAGLTPEQMEFEKFREDKVMGYMLKYEREREDFEKAFGEAATTFTSKLKVYLSHEHILRASITIEASRVQKSVSKSFLYSATDDAFAITEGEALAQPLASSPTNSTSSPPKKETAFAAFQ